MRKWTVRDRQGREIYLTEERWKHIREEHEELRGHFNDVLDAVRKGRRRQEPLDPQSYRYYWRCDSLPEGYTHIVVIIEFEIPLEDGTAIRCHYDKEGDILELFFKRGPATCTVELTDNIILRFDRESEEPLSLGLISYSALARLTETGPRGFRLKLDEIPDDVRQTVLKIITTRPVNRFLKVLAYSPQRARRPVPIAYVEQLPALTVAQKETA